MGFSRQEYWSGLPCPPPGDLPHPGILARSPALQAGGRVADCKFATWNPSVFLPQADACLAPGSSVHLASSRVHLPPSREIFLQFALWMLFADALEQRPVRTGMTWHWADQSIAFPGFTGNTQPQVGVPGGSGGKEYACNAGDSGSIPGWGRSLGGGNGNSLQYSGLENPMHRGAWQATVHGSQRDKTE